MVGGAGDVHRCTQLHSVVSRRAALLGLSAAALGCGRRPDPREGLRVGFVHNMTHAQPLLGATSAGWEAKLGEGARLMAFHGGPAVAEALSAGSIHAGFLGPSAVVNVFVRSGGRKVRIISGAAAGGASLVVRKASQVRGAPDMRGKVFSTSQIGSTPDVAIRTYVRQNGLRSSDQGGDVTLLPLTNTEAFELLKRGQLDGAWAQEPWASRMVAEARCERLIDERDLWPDGKFPSTLLVVSPQALDAAPDQVKRLVALVREQTDALQASGNDAARQIGDALFKVLGKRLKADVLAEAYRRLELTTDPLEAAVELIARRMSDLGYLPAGGVQGLVVRGLA